MIGESLTIHLSDSYIKKKGGGMRIIHLTDIHLSSNEDRRRDAHFDNFLRVINFINHNKCSLGVDAIVVTGDISHDGGSYSYDVFFHEMIKLGIPFYLCHGNHDNKEKLYEVGIKYADDFKIEYLYNDNWLVLSIDTVVNNEDYGFVSKDELDKFERMVKLSPEKNIALFLHHHLIPVGTPIVDDCMLTNASEVLDVCKRLNVRFIGSGHAHTLFQRQLGDTLLSVSPAVCFQWENGTKEVNFIKNSGFSVVCLNDHVHVETWFI